MVALNLFTCFSNRPIIKFGALNYLVLEMNLGNPSTVFRVRVVAFHAESEYSSVGVHCDRINITVVGIFTG